uniref:Uncharacterized protein n=1 Tax=Trichogramma kaykai TaxID=54128 RepID=A0ABD2XDJ9_9HYME
MHTAADGAVAALRQGRYRERERVYSDSFSARRDSRISNWFLGLTIDCIVCLCLSRFTYGKCNNDNANTLLDIYPDSYFIFHDEETDNAQNDDDCANDGSSNLYENNDGLTRNLNSLYRRVYKTLYFARLDSFDGLISPTYVDVCGARGEEDSYTLLGKREASSSEFLV